MVHNINDPQYYSKEQQQASEPDFYGKWLDVDLHKPQLDFEVIGCVDDDVEMCVYRNAGDNYWFELPSGREFKPSHWMNKPEPFNK